jgi:hypothetical protein
MPRNYRKEYDNYHSKPKQKKNRATLNAARAIMEKKGKVRKGDGKDVDHPKGVEKGNGFLKVKTVSSNRSFPRTKGARKK